jgi:hypothetical protein
MKPRAASLKMTLILFINNSAKNTVMYGDAG